MSGGAVVGHPVWDDGQGNCEYPGCGRRTRVYMGRLNHMRGTGGKGGSRPPPMAATEARARIHGLTKEVAALRARNAELEAMDRPWVGIHARLDRIERLLTPTVIDHRRIADGGARVRDQRRGKVA